MIDKTFLLKNNYKLNYESLKIWSLILFLRNGHYNDYTQAERDQPKRTFTEQSRLKQGATSQWRLARLATERVNFHIVIVRVRRRHTAENAVNICFC